LAGAERLDASRRRVRFVGDELDGFACRVSQQVAATVHRGGGTLRLLCQIERYDPVELRLETILAVEPNSALDQWPDSAQIGDPVDIELVGERKTPLRR
jgi:hypothetical protein